MKLESSKILITGASSGIGRLAAEKLVEAGCKVFATGRREETLKDLADQCGSDLSYKSADLTVPSQVAEMVAEAEERLEGMDGVIHAAGIGLIKPLEASTDPEFLKVTNTNVRGTFLLAKEVCPLMAQRKNGLFVAIPGILGKAPMQNASVYVCSKYAVTGFIKSLALEYQRKGLRFSLLHFGGVDSPFWDQIEMKVQRERMIPLEVAAEVVVQAVRTPGHLALNEVVLQPIVHQL